MKSILVTGANRGLGRGIVESLVKSGQPLTIFAASRSGEDSEVKSTEQCQIRPCVLDISSSTSISSLLSTLPKLDVVINNAGAQSIGQKQTFEVYKNVLDVNYRGTLKVYMPQRRIEIWLSEGHIADVSSCHS